MPGNYQLSVDRLVDEVGAALDLGVRRLHPVRHSRRTRTRPAPAPWMTTASCSRRCARCATAVHDRALLITDECFCEYTDHGHCGVLTEIAGRLDRRQRRDAAALAAQCVSHARAGADMVAPSGMMDGMVGAIRTGLDAAGFSQCRS